jgi:hypothetical protein
VGEIAIGAEKGAPKLVGGVEVPLGNEYGYGADHNFQRVIAIKLSSDEVATFTDGGMAVLMPLNQRLRSIDTSSDLFLPE